jgi:hypothetical protein
MTSVNALKLVFRSLHVSQSTIPIFYHTIPPLNAAPGKRINTLFWSWRIFSESACPHWVIFEKIILLVHGNFQQQRYSIMIIIYIITNIIIRETSRNATWRRIWKHLRWWKLRTFKRLTQYVSRINITVQIVARRKKTQESILRKHVYATNKVSELF